MWCCSRKTTSGFTSSSTAEEVTRGIDGSGLTAIVTGASKGIGVETARVLALHGVHVVMGVRNTVAGASVKEAIVNETPSAKISVMELDLSSMASVRKFAAEFISAGFPLNILINNAGILGVPFTLTPDNIELQFATNHVGHFLLTNLLLETMKKSSENSKFEGRIVNVSSVAHKSYPGGIRFDKLSDKSAYNAPYAYARTKLANVLHANELARRLKEEGVRITANSLHPGIISTDIWRNCACFSSVFLLATKLMGKDIHQGASTTCYVALHPQVEGVSGKYFQDNNVATPSKQAKDVKLAKMLWELSARLIGS